MPGTTPRGYPYPLPSDTINVPRDIQALAEEVDTDVAVAVGQSVPRFATMGALTAGIPAPVEGQMAYVVDPHTEVMRYTVGPNGTLQWIPLNQFPGAVYGISRQVGGKAQEAQIVAIAETGSAFASPGIGMLDQGGSGASMLWWTPLTRVTFNTADHAGLVFLQAAGYVTGTVLSLPEPYADLLQEETNTNGEPDTTVDLAKLVLRLVERQTAFEAFVNDKFAALAAALDPDAAAALNSVQAP